MFDLSKKIVVLTGGLGLLGLEYVKVLTEFGARVVVIDIQPRAIAQKIINKKIPKKFIKKVVYFQADITERSALLDIRQQLLKQYGRIDVLINNAALNPKVEGAIKEHYSNNAFEVFPLEQWEREFKVNVTGTMLCCQVFGGKLKSGGSIINIASIYGLVGPNQSMYSNGFIKPAAYGASKAAVVSLTQYLATYWGKKGVRVNAVALGGVQNGQDAEFVKKYSLSTPLGRMAEKHESNGIVIYLSSDASSYSTGSVHMVDGGWTAW